MLDKHGAPKQIDYLAINTEGGEYGILKSFDFKKYKISIIICEHNYNPEQSKKFTIC